MLWRKLTATIFTCRIYSDPTASALTVSNSFCKDWPSETKIIQNDSNFEDWSMSHMIQTRVMQVQKITISAYHAVSRDTNAEYYNCKYIYIVPNTHMMQSFLSHEVQIS